MRAVCLALFCLLAGAVHAAPATQQKAYLSVIIDDLGQSPAKDSRTLALPGPVTMAIMPDTPHATDFARQAHKAGRTVILHMPMDPATGPYAWHPGTPLPELEQRLNAALSKVPYAAGVNNHMGSRMTAQPEAMAWLMGELQRRDLFFVDSRTSAATVAAAKAQAIGLASVSRDVFLDDERTRRLPGSYAWRWNWRASRARRWLSGILIHRPWKCWNANCPGSRPRAWS